MAIGGTLYKFSRYEAVRRSGKYNMIMDAEAAADEAWLSLEDYFDVLEHYNEYKAKWEEFANSKQIEK